MVKIYKWLNKEKARFYTITVQAYGCSCFILNYHWGGCYSNRGGTKSLQVESLEMVTKAINDMKKRRKSRGYELVAPLVA